MRPKAALHASRTDRCPRRLLGPCMQHPGGLRSRSPEPSQRGSLRPNISTLGCPTHRCHPGDGQPNPPSGSTRAAAGVRSSGGLLHAATTGRAPNSRVAFFPIAAGVTPAMCLRLTGVGSQYLMVALDGNDDPFAGGRGYKVTLPPSGQVVRDPVRQPDPIHAQDPAAPPPFGKPELPQPRSPRATGSRPPAKAGSGSCAPPRSARRVTPGARLRRSSDADKDEEARRGRAQAAISGGACHTSLPRPLGRCVAESAASAFSRRFGSVGRVLANQSP